VLLPAQHALYHPVQHNAINFGAAVRRRASQMAKAKKQMAKLGSRPAFVSFDFCQLSFDLLMHARQDWAHT
jgi:hypothetical protein